MEIKSEQVGPWRDAGRYCLRHRECEWFRVVQFIRDGNCYLKLVCGGDLGHCLMVGGDVR